VEVVEVAHLRGKKVVAAAVPRLRGREVGGGSCRAFPMKGGGGGGGHIVREGGGSSRRCSLETERGSWWAVPSRIRIRKRDSGGGSRGLAFARGVGGVSEKGHPSRICERGRQDGDVGG
jgi:hypothetical protein